MKHVIRTTITISAVCLCFMLFTIPVSAKGKNTKAHQAYNKALLNGKIVTRSSDTKYPYAFYDINGDGIDELILFPGHGYHSYSVYTYYSGKVKEVIAIGQSYGNLKIYPKKKVIYFENSGHMGTLEDSYYKISKGKAVKAASDVRGYGKRDYDQKPITTSSYVNGKKVSRSKYLKYVKNLKKGKAVSHNKLKWNYILSKSMNSFSSSRKKETVYLMFKGQGTKPSFRIQRGAYRPYKKIEVTLADSKKKAIGKKVVSTGDSFNYSSADYGKKITCRKNKIYYLKITTHSESGDKYGYYSTYKINF